MENHHYVIPVVMTWYTYCLCWYTDWVGEPSEFHNSRSYLMYISSVSIHWLGWRSLRVSSQWFLLDLHFVCVETLIGLENQQSFIKVVLTWTTYCRVLTLIGLENHQSFITVVLIWSTYCLCWYTDSFGQLSAFHNGGSYSIYILSVLKHWLSWRTIRIS